MPRHPWPAQLCRVTPGLRSWSPPSSVAGEADSPAERAVIDAIIQVSARLALQTVVEGVERLDQRRLPETSGANGAQGYLYSRPVPAPDFAAWLAEHQADGAVGGQGHREQRQPERVPGAAGPGSVGTAPEQRRPA